MPQLSDAVEICPKIKMIIIIADLLVDLNIQVQKRLWWITLETVELSVVETHLCGN